MRVVDYRYIEDWLDSQDLETVASVFAALGLLERDGPNLGRPLVDTLKGSAIANLKELRPAVPGRAEVRILFASDPKRQAIMLLAGDKSKGRSGRRKWAGWCKSAIPRAERIYRSHLEAMGE